jgi:hypothetical protein
MTLTRRQKKHLAALGLTITFATITTILSLALVAGGSKLPSPTGTIVLLALLSALGILSCLPWWRALDEMQRDTNLASWYWGSCWGGGTGALSALVIGGPDSAVAKGAIMVVFCQLLGSSVIWIAMRLIRRPQAA